MGIFSAILKRTAELEHQLPFLYPFLDAVDCGWARMVDFCPITTIFSVNLHEIKTFIIV